MSYISSELIYALVFWRLLLGDDFAGGLYVEYCFGNFFVLQIIFAYLIYVAFLYPFQFKMCIIILLHIDMIIVFL